MSGPAGNRHPDEMELALYAGSDLGFWRSWMLRRHVSGCSQCQQEVEILRSSHEFLQEAATEMPAGLAWSRLSAEMRANVKLGLTVGAIAGPVDDPPRPMGWRVAAAFACVVVLVISGWWLHLPRPSAVAMRSRAPVEQQVLLKTTRSGIEMEENGLSLAFVHYGKERATLTAGLQGELRARYIDDETGEVTIHHVYVE